MKSVPNSLAVAIIALAFASCAEPTKKAAVTTTAPTGLRFDGVGKIALHEGQPCASQIMFDLQTASASAPIWLAAPMRETKLLTDVAKHRRRAHVWGKWQRGKTKGCNYVNVTKAEPQKSAW